MRSPRPKLRRSSIWSLCICAARLAGLFLSPCLRGYKLVHNSGFRRFDVPYLRYGPSSGPMRTSKDIGERGRWSRLPHRLRAMPAFCSSFSTRAGKRVRVKGRMRRWEVHARVGAHTGREAHAGWELYTTWESFARHCSGWQYLALLWRACVKLYPLKQSRARRG